MGAETQISTFVVACSAICVVLPRHVGVLVFNHLLYALLVCVCVVPVASECTQTEKWPWMAFKIFVLLANLYIHKDRLNFGYKNFAFSAALLVMYLCVVDLRRAYECDVKTQHLFVAAVSAAILYVLVSITCTRLRRR
jgi:hypothetical protein